ncbi:MAG: hypothetical protein AAGN35_20925 [Bacteroidota bacterium]
MNIQKLTIFFALLFGLMNGGAALAQTDTTFGVMSIGTWPNNGNFGAVAHQSQFNTATSYALLQANTGDSYLNAASGRSLFLRIANQNALTINSARNVGVGTTAPQARLHVSDPTVPSVFISGSGFRTQLAVATTAGFFSPLAAQGDAVLRSFDGDLMFYSIGDGFRWVTGNGPAATERMSLSHDGKLGIGRPAPSYELDVAGTVRADDGIRFANTSSPELRATSEGLVLDGGTLFAGRQDLIKFNTFREQVNIGSDQNFVNGFTLTVDGKVLVEELKVQNSTNWPDYVFAPDYELADLESVEAFIDANQHLPDVPSAAELKDGVEIGEMQKTLLRKVEELTLYVIELNQTVKAQREQITELQAEQSK